MRCVLLVGFFGVQFGYSLHYAIKISLSGFFFVVCGRIFFLCYTSFILWLLPVNFIYHLGKQIYGCRVRVTGSKNSIDC